MNKYYIHNDKTVEFYGVNPVLTEMEVLDLALDLSCRIEIKTTKEDEELHKQAPWNQPCTYCDSVEHKWENCPDANDDAYDDAKQNGLL